MARVARAARVRAVAARVRAVAAAGTAVAGTAMVAGTAAMEEVLEALAAAAWASRRAMGMARRMAMGMARVTAVGIGRGPDGGLPVPLWHLWWWWQACRPGRPAEGTRGQALAAAARAPQSR